MLLPLKANAKWISRLLCGSLLHVPKLEGARHGLLFKGLKPQRQFVCLGRLVTARQHDRKAVLSLTNIPHLFQITA